MGWAERSNPNSEWNRKRAGIAVLPASTQTTQKENFVQAPTPIKQGEPVVVELSLKTIWDYLCRRLKTLFSKKLNPSHALTS